MILHPIHRLVFGVQIPLDKLLNLLVPLAGVNNSLSQILLLLV